MTPVVNLPQASTAPVKKFITNFLKNQNGVKGNIGSPRKVDQ
jgi:hypothetical protein